MGKLHPLFGRLIDVWKALDDAGKLALVEYGERIANRRAAYEKQRARVEYAATTADEASQGDVLDGVPRDQSREAPR